MEDVVYKKYGIGSAIRLMIFVLLLKRVRLKLATVNQAIWVVIMIASILLLVWRQLKSKYVMYITMETANLTMDWNGDPIDGRRFQTKMIMT